MSALAKPRAERPASAGAFANALRSTAEGEVQLLRQAKYHYSQMMPTFIGVSLATRAPFILLSALLSLMLESLMWVPPAWGFIGFWLIVLWLILSSNGLHTAACTLVIKQLRLAPLNVVPWRPILKATLRCLPELLLATLRSQWSVLLGLVRFIAPGLKRCVDHALYPAVVVMEGEKGVAALDRSRMLVARLRVMALAFEARDFGISLGSVLLFSFFVILGMIWSGTPRENMFGVLRALHLPALAYCWFFVVATHPSFAGIPLALLYFRARQAGGETIEEAFVENFEAQTSRTRPNKLNKGTLGWLLVPLLMLAAMIAGPWWGGEQSLIGAVQRGRHSTVQRLLASGAAVESRGAGGMTALMIAAREGHLDIARLLMAAGAQIEARSDQGYTPLMSAALAGHAEMVQALLAAGAEVNAKDHDGETALMLAARRGRLEVIKVLLSAGASSSAADKNGKTALMYAEEEGYPEAARLLGEAGRKQ
jgi:hypothetical protein